MKSWEAGKKTKALAVPICTIQDESHPMWDPTSHLVWDILDTSKSEIVILISLRKWKDGNYLLYALALAWKELRHRLQGVYWVSLHWPYKSPKKNHLHVGFYMGRFIQGKHPKTSAAGYHKARETKLPVHNATKMGRIPPWQCQTAKLTQTLREHKTLQWVDCTMQSHVETPRAAYKRKCPVKWTTC